MITRNRLLLLTAILAVLVISIGINLYLKKQNKIKPNKSLKISKDRSPDQIYRELVQQTDVHVKFKELAQTDGVYVKKTWFSIIDHQSSPIFEQVFYANKSNALLRITINKDKDSIVSGDKALLQNIIYVQGKVFDWLEHIK